MPGGSPTTVYPRNFSIMALQPSAIKHPPLHAEPVLFAFFLFPVTSYAGFSWKGQSGAITKLLQLLVLQAADPSQCLVDLITSTLKEVPGKVATKQQLEPVAGYAALCSATFLAWYK